MTILILVVLLGLGWDWCDIYLITLECFLWSLSLNHNDFENFSAIPPTNAGLGHQWFRVVACSFLFVDMNLCMCADSLIIWGWGEFAGWDFWCHGKDREDCLHSWTGTSCTLQGCHHLSFQKVCCTYSITPAGRQKDWWTPVIWEAML